MKRKHDKTVPPCAPDAKPEGVERTGQKRVEVVKQVRLSPSQRIALMEAANNGGKIRNTESGVRIPLRYLKLIEERDEKTPEQRKQEAAALIKSFASLATAARKRDGDECYKIASAIHSTQWNLDRKAWWITDAGREYLATGKVVVIAGDSK